MCDVHVVAFLLPLLLFELLSKIPEENETKIEMEKHNNIVILPYKFRGKGFRKKISHKLNGKI